MTKTYTEPPEERDKSYGQALETFEQMGFGLELITSSSYNYQVLQSLSDQEREVCKQLLLRHFISAKYGGTQFKQGIEAGDLEAMATCLSKARLDMAYISLEVTRSKIRFTACNQSIVRRSQEWFCFSTSNLSS